MRLSCLDLDSYIAQTGVYLSIHHKLVQASLFCHILMDYRMDNSFDLVQVQLRTLGIPSLVGETVSLGCRKLLTSSQLLYFLQLV